MALDTTAATNSPNVTCLRCRSQGTTILQTVHYAVLKELRPAQHEPDTCSKVPHISVLRNFMLRPGHVAIVIFLATVVAILPYVI